ncbi:MAG: hypothetical protein E7376_02615 [Clostridiales bacterium]|nr:hypothetical protein [Clostridiales bacterium]
MKKNIKLLINIAAICLCVCAMAIGVYAAKQASLSTKGTITFTAVGCDLEITGTLSGYATDIYATTTSTKDLTKVTLNDTNNYTGAVDVGAVYFSEFASEEPQIVMTLNIKNNSKFKVSGYVSVPDTVADGNIEVKTNIDKVNMSAETGTATVVITFALTNLKEDTQINLSELTDLNIQFEKFTDNSDVPFYIEDDILYLEFGTYPTEVAEGETDIYGDYKGKPIRWFAFAKVDGTVDETTGVFTKTEVLQTLSGKKGSADTDTCDVLDFGVPASSLCGSYYFISEFILDSHVYHKDGSLIDKDGDGSGTETAPSHDYQYADIRTYLESEFIEKFGIDIITQGLAIERILEPEAGNVSNPTGGYDTVTNMENCSNKLWLLSETEVSFLTARYSYTNLGTFTSLTCYPKNDSNYAATQNDNRWGTRTPAPVTSSCIKYISGMSIFQSPGSYVYEEIGIRPAFQVTIPEGAF